MSELPSGTVSFLFTDIEGSTRLLHALGDSYAEALADHRRTLREAFRQHGGVEVDTQGDAFFVAFARANDALAAAADAQRALEQGPIRVRIGVHTGEPLLTDEGYVGMDVHRAARIAAAGHGGQILVSASTRELVTDHHLRDLGEHRLKDLSGPERIYQLGERHFAPLKTLRETNLPVPTTPFLGRERELSAVLELARCGTRLLTLTGPGGTGKTRLGLQAAAELADDHEDGVFWVSLAPLREPDLVLEVAAQTLGAREELAVHIGERHLLLLLDNFEHVIGAAPKVGALLSACPHLDLLVTSRERLAIAGEQEYTVPTLEVREGVSLFSERARALDPAFVPDEAVEEVCARLDYLPLALELAAARIKLFSPERLLERLSSRLDLLKGGRDGDPRQQTLRATIEWSYDLLEDEEQRVFARLSIFAGGCLFEEAEAICGADPDTLGSLIDKSLVRSRSDRFSMLETIRQFAADKLEQSGAADETRSRHAQRFAALAFALSGTARFSDQEALSRLAAEHDNMRIALALAVERGDLELGEQLVVGLWYFWVSQGFTAEGDRWARRLLAAASNGAGPELLIFAGELARFAGDLDRAVELKEQAILRCEREGERSRLAAAITDLAETLVARGDLDRAKLEAERALAIRVELGGSGGMAHARDALVRLEFRRGDFALAAALAEESLADWRMTESWTDIAQELYYAASAYRRLGNLAGAQSLLQDGLRLAVRARDWAVAAVCLEEASALAAARGDIEQALRLRGAVHAWRETSGFSWSLDQEEPEQIERTLTERDAQRLLGEGRALSLEAAVAYALTEVGD
jgi:predicted ATPase/class 3 adenylate cyclase